MCSSDSEPSAKQVGDPFLHRLDVGTPKAKVAHDVARQLYGVIRNPSSPLSQRVQRHCFQLRAVRHVASAFRGKRINAARGKRTAPHSEKCGAEPHQLGIFESVLIEAGHAMDGFGEIANCVLSRDERGHRA